MEEIQVKTPARNCYNDKIGTLKVPNLTPWQALPSNIKREKTDRNSSYLYQFTTELQRKDNFK